MRRFTGIDLISDLTPDETMLLSFRDLLERHALGDPRSTASQKTASMKWSRLAAASEA